MSSPAALSFAPLTNTELMVRRAQSEDAAASHLVMSVRDEHHGDAGLFLRLAHDSAGEAIQYDDALVQRLRYSPQGIGRAWPTAIAPTGQEA